MLKEAKILTMNPQQPQAEAVAIKDGKILLVGSSAEIELLVGKETKVISCQGKTVVPGFTDTHIHVADFAKFLLWLDLIGTGSIKELQDKVKDRTEKMEKGKWVVGRGWNEQLFSDKLMPNRFDLDAVSQDNPVMLYYHCGPVCLANTQALNLAKITKQTENPQDGSIEKDGAGEPTGILKGTATNLVWKIIPQPTTEEVTDACKLAFQKIVEAGITCIHWMAESLEELTIYEMLRKKQEIPIKVFMIIPVKLFLDLANKPDFSKTAEMIDGVEISADGYLAFKTAALQEPYSDDSTNGELLYTSEQIRELIQKITDNKLKPIVHAMGDEAINQFFNAIYNQSGKNDLRLDQAALLNPDLIQKAKQTGVIISVQPLVAASEFSVYNAKKTLGEERCRWLYPINSLIREGLCVCGGSDCPMEPLDPLLGIQWLITREDLPEERLNLDEALQIYTIKAAHATSEERIIGSIEQGKTANIILFSEDLSAIDPAELSKTHIIITISNGKIVFNKSAI